MGRDGLSQMVTRLTADPLPGLELNPCYEILLDISLSVLQACKKDDRKVQTDMYVDINIYMIYMHKLKAGNTLQ